MSVITEYTLPANDFVLGRAIQPEMRAEVERFVPDGNRVVPYFWVTVDGADHFEESLATAGSVVELQRLDEMASQYLYRGVCEPAADTLIGGLLEHDAGLLFATGDDDEWTFTLSFEDEGTVSEFQTFVVDSVGATLKLEHIYTPVGRDHRARVDLTLAQREALVTALEKGYYDIPRRITLVDLSEELDVSDQAVSERLRRGESKLIRRHLLEDVDREE